MTQVKICGITTLPVLDATCRHGADFAGLVFYPGSPRFVDLDQATNLCTAAAGRIRPVGLFVDPSLKEIGQVLSRTGLDMIQLHGNETPAETELIRRTFGVETIKALRIEEKNPDWALVSEYRDAADWLLFDRGAGDGICFDWSILKKYNDPSRKWMLAGGLSPENVSNAIEYLTPPAIDVSSGVESTPGIKDPASIASFLAIAKKS